MSNIHTDSFKLLADLCALGDWKVVSTSCDYDAAGPLAERQPVERTSLNCHTIATPGGFRHASRLGPAR